MPIFAVHLRDDSSVLLPGRRVEPAFPDELRQLGSVIGRWDAADEPERVVFVDVVDVERARSFVPWIERAIRVELDVAELAAEPEPASEIAALRWLEVELPEASQGPVQRKCPECKRVFGHRDGCSRRKR